MSWIEEIQEDQATGELAALYRELIEKRGKLANILKVHSLNPPSLKHHLDLYLGLMFGKSGLSRAERESIAVVTSASNHCDYCVNHHAVALSNYQKNADVLEAIRAAEDFSKLPPRTRAMLAHAKKLTCAPDEMTQEDLQNLRRQGFSDRDILDITLITAYFNFVNRIALGLGVEFNEEEMVGYKT